MVEKRPKTKTTHRHVDNLFFKHKIIKKKNWNPYPRDQGTYCITDEIFS